MTVIPRLVSNHALDQFQKYLITHNKSPDTTCVYRYAVEQFYHLYSRLIPRNLQLYKAYSLERYKLQTVNLRIRALNYYMEYGQASITSAFMIKIQQKTYLGKIISQADYEYLKWCPAENEEYTYYFIVRLTTATRVRINKLIIFQIEDVYTGHKDIYSKGNKTRRVYIPRGLVRELQEWLTITRRSTGPLFPDRFHSPISPSGIRAQFKIFAAWYGPDPEVVYPHSLRHHLVKNFIEKCGDISLLPDLLGHENIETTRIYLRRSSSEQYHIVNKVADWQRAHHKGI